MSRGTTCSPFGLPVVLMMCGYVAEWLGRGKADMSCMTKSSTHFSEVFLVAPSMPIGMHRFHGKPICSCRNS